MEHLYEGLAEYAGGSDYPYHMPGHKRRAFGEMPREILRMDITEIEGFDNLHAPEGILLDLQRRASVLYGAEESFCLVNGSTCGILSAVSAAVPMGGKLLMARNCHKSVYHAAYLRKLRISYLYPSVMKEFEIPEAVTPQQVREALQREEDIDAVIIVSPTYEGRIARAREIAEIVHGFGKILIVDEAHGAHLGLAGADPEYPENSCRAGADLVIHSVHKTLPAMTQTALLHVNGPRVNRELLKRFLRIYQSSSPSYVLLASVDNALTMAKQGGQKLFGDFYREFRALMLELQGCRRLKFLAARPDPEKEGFLDACRQDVGKLVICSRDLGMTGQELYDRLRQQYHLQPEMAAGDYCLAMFTVGDTPEGYRRMAQALLEIDQSPPDGREFAEEEYSGRTVEKTRTDAENVDKDAKSAAGCEFCQAWDLPWEELPLRECVGRMAADFVNLYPPGIPLLVPGERFTQELCGKLRVYKSLGLNLQGVRGGEMRVKCIVQNKEGEKR